MSYTIPQTLDGTRNDWEASDSFWVNVKVPEGLIERKKIDTGFAVFVVQKRVQMLPRERVKQSDAILKPKKKPTQQQTNSHGDAGAGNSCLHGCKSEQAAQVFVLSATFHCS